jgi:NADH-quinone oxidoreductase subunit N
MSISDLIALLPILILASGIVLILLALSLTRSPLLTWTMTLLTLTLSLIALPISSSSSSPQVMTLMIFDGYALFYMAVILGAAMLICILSYGYLAGRKTIREEYYILILIATLGCCCLASSCHFVSFFLALEMVSVSLYALVAYLRAEPIHAEAGIKYLIPAATSVAFLLMGIAVVYAWSGSMSFSAMIFQATDIPVRNDPLLMAGLIMILIGVGFKLALVPFHLWAADVYEGSPAPIAGFIATASKGAVFALLLRYWTVIHAQECRPLYTGMVVVAAITMFVGNLSALLQRNLKRILAYSSIAHMGYLLTALLAGGSWATTAVTLYWLAYFITTLGAFGVITVLSDNRKDVGALDEVRGLAFQHPFLAGIFTLFLLSLAGLPLTAGFIGKFFIFYANADADRWFLLAVLVINSAIGIFYYLRIVIVLYSPADQSQGVWPSEIKPGLSRSFADGAILVFLSVLLLAMGVYPSPFLGWIRLVIQSLA